MANLLDTIRQNNPALQQQGQTDQSANLQTLLRAKSGKAISGPEVAASNLQEQQTVDQTNNQLQNQIAPAAAIQNQQQQQQAVTQAQQVNQQGQEIAQQRKFDTLQTRLKTDQILSDLERNKGQINMQRDRAAVEQLGTNLRLQDQNYTQQLQREGNLARLGDQNSFQQSLQRNILGDNQQLLEKQLGNSSVLDANDRQFKQAMANMDINTAWDMFHNDMVAQKQRALYTGLGSLATAGIGAYGAMNKPAANGTSGPNTGTTGDLGAGDAGSVA